MTNLSAIWIGQSNSGPCLNGESQFQRYHVFVTLLTMSFYKMSRNYSDMHDKFVAFPTRFRHEHRLLAVLEQAFDTGTRDIARSTGLQIMSVKIFAGGTTHLSLKPFSLLTTSSDAPLLLSPPSLLHLRWPLVHLSRIGGLGSLHALRHLQRYTGPSRFRGRCGRICGHNIAANIVTPSLFQSTRYKSAIAD